MRRIESDSFNKKVTEKINEPHNRLGKINFENVNVFDSKFQGIGTGDNTIDVKFSDLATVDGVEMAKVNGAMRYLEGSKVETLDIYESIDVVAESITSGSEASLTKKFNIPPQYDGRNSYVEVVYGRSSPQAVVRDKFQNLEPIFTDEYVLALGLNEDSASMAQKSVFKTEKYVKLKHKISNSVLDIYLNENLEDLTLNLYVHIYLWRYV